MDPSSTAVLPIRSQMFRASSGVRRASADCPIRPSACWILSSDTSFRNGDCSSCTDRPWRSVSSKTASPVVFLNSARTIVSAAPSSGDRRAPPPNRPNEVDA